MQTETFLFLLRLFSSGVLLGVLGTLFYVMWQEYRSTLQQIASSRRTYGRLVALQKVDTQYVALDDTYPLLPLTCLGRSPTNQVVLDDSFASHEHAQVVLRNGQWWLEDRRSRNGTMLNEVLINQPVVMTSGDIIGIGQKRFRLDLE